MKSRKIVVIAFVLVAALSLGIGYASLTDQLFINGTSELLRSNVNPVFDEKVFISNAEMDSATASISGNTTSVSQTDNDKASFTADGLKEKDDTAVFIFTISNKNDVAATLAATITSTYDTNLFDVKYQFAGKAVNTAGEIASGTEATPATTTITITVTLKETPTFEDDITAITAKFDFTINATSKSSN